MRRVTRTGRRLAGILLAASAACTTGSANTGSERADAIAEAKRGNPVTALRMLRRVVDQNPADSVAYTQIADLYRRFGWSRDGYVFFRQRAVNQDDRYPELRYYAAAFAALTGHGDDAERWLAAGHARRAPDEAEALAIAEALAVIGRGPAAKQVLEEAARGYPDRFEPRVRFAIALANAGDTAAADRELTAALVRFPEEPRVLGAAANLRFIMGDLGRSEALTIRWLVVDPKNAEARWNLTRIALQRNDYHRADSLLLLTAQTRR